MRKWAVALAALWMVMGSPPVSLGAEGVTLPKDLPLPTDASVAIYLPKHIREFRNPFRSGVASRRRMHCNWAPASRS